MAYEVILDDFQGPLDLLLHLIKEKEMDLETLEVSVITDQYLAYIDQIALPVVSNGFVPFQFVGDPT